MTATTTSPTRRRVLPVAAAVAVVAVVVAILVVVRHAQGDTVPYRDTASTGRLTLCDEHLKPITSGSTKGAPFVWRAVGSSPAPARLAVTGRSATLYAFQPRQGVDPTQWSGQELTASSQYTKASHPAAQATKADIDLADFLSAYPAKDSGYVQLRLLLSAPDAAPQVDTYDTADIKVTGSSWHLVGGGHGSCTAGDAVSFETLTSVPTPSSAP